MPKQVKSPGKVLASFDARFVHEALLKTFESWTLFATKRGKLGGKMIKNPSGRMAAAMKAEFNQDGEVVAIYIDEDEVGAESYEYFTSGHKAFSLRDKMLKLGKPGVKKTKKGPHKGSLYKRVLISDKPKKPSEVFSEAKRITNLFTTQEFPQGGGLLGINKNLARMWMTSYSKAHETGKIRTMSNRPGAATWRVPAMPAFNVAKLLRDMLPSKLKDRVIL